MEKLDIFIRQERERYEHDNNQFAFSLGQASRYYKFLHVIYSRHVEANAKFMDNTNRMLEATSKHKSGSPLSEDLWQLHIEGRDVTQLLHLEQETFYLFGTIFVDRVASFIEAYFGLPKNKSRRLNTHYRLNKGLERYAGDKELVLPAGFADSVAFLQDNLSDLRNEQVTHDESWRSMHGTSFTSDGEARISKIQLYPQESDKQVEYTELRELMAAIEKYVDELVALVELNRPRAQFS